jgi:hypothetical protein
MAGDVRTPWCEDLGLAPGGPWLIGEPSWLLRQPLRREGTFAMVKAAFGDAVLSKLPV